MIEGWNVASWLTMFWIVMRRSLPIAAPTGPRMRLPRRRNSGGKPMPRMVMLLMAMSSVSAPSIVSSAMP